MVDTTNQRAPIGTSPNAEGVAIVDFVITHNGLTISGERFTTARFLPFDVKGKCRQCGGNTVEIDVAMTGNGVTISCSRIKDQKNLDFDKLLPLPNNSYFKVKSRSSTFIIPFKENLQQIKEEVNDVVDNKSIEE
jgi:hypothetical protein